MAKDPITTRHPLYDAHCKEWEYYSLAYEAGLGYPKAINSLTGDRIVTRFPLESQADYTYRLNRSVQVDICSPAVDLLSGAISNIIVTAPDQLLPIMDDVDMMGTSFLQFMSAARAKAAVYGHVFILVDSTRFPEGEIRTQADVVRKNIRPYLRVVTPLQLTNWRLDGNGKLLEAVYRIEAPADQSILAGPQEPVYEYRYWSKERWAVYRATGGGSGDEEKTELVEEGANPIGIVPLAPLYHKLVEPMLGDSLLKQSAAFQQKLTNWLSSMDSILERQSFAQPVLWSRSKPSEVGIGSAAILHLAPAKKEGDVTIEAERFDYVAPDPGPLTLAWDSFFRVLRMAMESMSLPGDVADESGSSPESGVAKAYRFRNTERRLQTMSLNEREAAKTVRYMVCRWLGNESLYSNIAVQYPTTFDLATLEDKLPQLVALVTAGVPPAAKRLLLRSAIHQALPDLPQADVDRIDRELEQLAAAGNRLRQMTE